MSARRAEIRRIQRENEKQNRKDLSIVRDIRKIAEKTGAEITELELWQATETERIRREMNLQLGIEYQKRYEELAEQYNQRLREGNIRMNEEVQRRTKVLMDDLTKSFNLALKDTEELICLANILITAETLHTTWGYKGAINKFLANWESSRALIERIGVKAMMERVNKDYGLDFEFDEFDVQKLIDTAGEMDTDGMLKLIGNQIKWSEVLPNVV